MAGILCFMFIKRNINTISVKLVSNVLITRVLLMWIEKNNWYELWALQSNLVFTAKNLQQQKTRGS